MLENLDLVPTASQLNQNFCLDHSDSLKKKKEKLKVHLKHLILKQKLTR